MKRRVLLVEDNPGDALLVQNMLALAPDLDCRLLVEDRLTAALVALATEPFALILLDLTLPDSQGLDTAVAVRKAAPNTPIVVLTGLDDHYTGVEAIRLGVQDYLSKSGLNSDVLVRTVRHALERHRLVKEQELLIADLDAFSHTVAHDLKNPLAIITGYASFLADELQDHPDTGVVRSIKEIVTHSLRMNNIVNELLLLAHVRDRQVEMQPLAMARIVDSALRHLQPLLTESGAKLVVPASWPTALGHAPWIEEVWVNYLSNAIKYGGSPPVIALGSEADGNGRIRFWVEDNGRGLTETDIAAVFKPFTRLDQVQVDGHGLGLSIVQRIVTNLKGDVFVESQPGQGSCFGFALPAAAAAVDG